MRRILLGSFFFVLVFCGKISAQCPGCAINTFYTSPGIYPNPLPDGTQNQPYDQDITFVMFTDTMGFTVNYFQILSVNNMPFGLNWECNNAGNGCQYDPSQSIYGCVKVCGTPIQTGTFIINVDVVANLQIVGNQNSTINISLTINAASGGNSGFTYTPTTSCDSATVQFDALIDGSPNPTTYDWNFGNGNTGTIMSESQNYNSPGDYTVTLQTNILGYEINSVSVNSVNTNWCGDVEEPSIPFVGCTGDPDLVFEISDAGANIIYTSSEMSNTQSATWSGLNIPLSNPPFSITIWDIDVISANDNLGTFSFSGNSTGTFPFSGAGGTSGSITIGTSVLASFNDTAVMSIYSSPEIPLITLSGNDTLCVGDSVTLSIANTANDNVQWYNHNQPIVNATTNQLVVNATGSYSVTAINTNGCDSKSDSVKITVLAALPNITFQISGDTLHCFLSQYSLQWHLDNTPIANATNPTLVINQTGNYFVIATNAFGCSASSDTYHLNYNLSPNMADEVYMNVFPVPVKNLLQVELLGWKSKNATLTINDLSGKSLIVKEIEMDNNGSNLKFSLSTENLSSGIYLLRIQSDAYLINRKIIVQK